MKKILLVAFLLFCFIDLYCQDYGDSFVGFRKIKALSVDRINSKDHYIVKVLDSALNKQFVILSERDGEATCDSLEFIKTGFWYNMDIEIYPLAPLSLSQDSLLIMFDSMPVEVSLTNDVKFTKKKPPYQARQIIRGFVCRDSLP